MTDDHGLLRDGLASISARTNAIDAVNAGLAHEHEIIAELMQLIFAEAPDVERVRAKVKELRELNEALPGVVAANVVPSTAGPVGLSSTEHLLAQAEGVVGDGLAQVAGAAKQAQELVQHLNTMFEHLHRSASAVAAVKDVSNVDH